MPALRRLAATMVYRYTNHAAVDRAKRRAARMARRAEVAEHEEQERLKRMHERMRTTPSTIGSQV